VIIEVVGVVGGLGKKIKSVSKSKARCAQSCP
jgi:hypothetical protein